ncbi:MAG: amidohydrolase family protein [Pseudomonadota bacterium]
MRIDAHQHFWALARGDYGWLTPDLSPIYRDFGPSDLTPLLEERGIDGTVLVQAAPTEDETDYMLDVAAETPFVAGVVGWVNFASADASARIAERATSSLVGLRPMIQDIEDPDWMLRPNLAPAFAALIDHDLVFEALTLPRHLSNLRRLLARHPGMRVVVDHASKPAIRDGSFEPWATEMAAIAAETAAFVKLSGLVTEAADGWSTATLKPYTDHLLATFGPSRMIWGSDWPVCTLGGSYAEWWDATEELLAPLSTEDRAGILGLNAAKAYGLAQRV